MTITPAAGVNSIIVDLLKPHGVKEEAEPFD